MDFSVDVRGADELTRRLAQIADDRLAQGAVYSALSASATVMKRDARRRAVVAGKAHQMRYSNGGKVMVLPGLLKSSIRHRKIKLSEKGKLGLSASEVGLSIYVGKGSKQRLFPRYWHFVEKGTAKMSAIPFLRPAFLQNHQAVADRFASKLADNLSRLGV